MPTSTIDYADVQGTILRGYRVDMARHFILQITDAPGARAFIANLVDGTGGVPRITTAARWTAKPECFVNLSFTCPGLAALGIPQAQLQSFDLGFQRGATSAKTASLVGDVGESAPANWIGGLSNGQNVHVVLNLWVDEHPEVLEQVSAQLRAAFAGCMTELSAHDARALPDNHVHFGYRDNIAQPTVQGAPPRKRPVPDDQPVVPTGEFLLGYLNANNATYSVLPAELSTNSSYAAFRILEQDVAGFEHFLQTFAPQGMDPEMLAAKVCGRWRNGNPLELMPDEPGTVLPSDQLNAFHYVSTDPAQDDTLGLRCPIGSHIRRNNPRDMAVVSTQSVNHRIVRRAMPYGPAYDPAHPDDVPRGLIGYFINGSITNQFEFLQGQWDLTPNFVMSATGPGGSDAGNAVFNISGEDVFLGVNDPAGSSFTLPALGKNGTKNTHVTGFSRMITTRGGAYCFLPSITGLRYLAALT
ncbi:MAG: Dyp-type peroxidase [Longimicrobiaceae bacterium]